MLRALAGAVLAATTLFTVSGTAGAQTADDPVEIDVTLDVKVCHGGTQTSSVIEGQQSVVWALTNCVNTPGVAEARALQVEWDRRGPSASLNLSGTLDIPVTFHVIGPAGSTIPGPDDTVHTSVAPYISVVANVANVAWSDVPALVCQTGKPTGTTIAYTPLAGWHPSSGYASTTPIGDKLDVYAGMFARPPYLDGMTLEEYTSHPAQADKTLREYFDADPRLSHIYCTLVAGDSDNKVAELSASAPFGSSAALAATGLGATIWVARSRRRSRAAAAR